MNIAIPPVRLTEIHHDSSLRIAERIGLLEKRSQFRMALPRVLGAY